MKKILTLSLITLLFLASPLYASSLRTITLKDGSVLKGKVVSLSNGIYKVQTENIGQIDIKESKIQSISDSTIAPKASAHNSSLDVSSQMQVMQTTLMSDPEMMQKVQGLMNNKNIMEIIQDPNIMKDLMTMDEDTIMNNPNIQKLLSDPQMKSVIHAAEKKLSPTQK